MYRSVVLCLIILMLIPCVSVASPLNITSRHGETWIVWNWTIPSSLIDNDTSLSVKVDGVVTHNVKFGSNVTIPTSYYLTGINSNEQHTIRIDIHNETTILMSDTDVETTLQSSVYNYLIFVIAVILMLFALFIVSRVISVVLLVVSFILSLFMSITTSIVNQSFSIVSIIMSVLCGFLILYKLYELWLRYTIWESD